MRLGDGVELRVAGYQFPDAVDPGQRYSWHQVEGRAEVPGLSWTFRYPALTCDETTRISTWLRDVARGAAPAALSFTEPNLAFAVAPGGIDVSLEQEFAPPSGPCVIRCVLPPALLEQAADAWDAETAAYPDAPTPPGRPAS